MSRILYLCHRLPYAPDKGCRLRAFNHLEGLAQGHEVHLVSFSERRVEPERAQALRQLCAAVEVFVLPPALAYLRCLVTAWRRRPLTHGFFARSALWRRVRELAADPASFDGVVAFSSAMGPYALPFGRASRLLDMVDVDSEKWRQYARSGPWPMRPAYALEARRLRRYERAAPAAFTQVTLATDRETHLLRDLAGDVANVSTVRNGIDADYFLPAKTPRSPRPTLVFTGQMDYYPNVDAASHLAREVFPRLRALVPDLELLIVGRAPSRTVQGLSEVAGVTVTGEVPDVRPFLARAWVFVAPLRIARGVQNKVLEAMACGVPVVCSRPVFDGLADGGFLDGRDLLVAADDFRLVHHLTRLVADAAERERLASSARRQVLAAYSWRRSAAQIERLLLGTAPPERRESPARELVAGA